MDFPAFKRMHDIPVTYEKEGYRTLKLAKIHRGDLEMSPSHESVIFDCQGARTETGSTLTETDSRFSRDLARS